MSAEIKALRATVEKLVQDKKAAFEKAKDEYAAAIKRLSQFDDLAKAVFGGEEPAPRKKPGPKPGTKRTKVVKAAEPPAPKKAKKGRKAKKVAPAKKAAPAKKEATKKTKRGYNKFAAEGRAAVLRGDRPPIKEAISKVMGSKVMNATTIADLLKEKKWLPNSNDPKAYIAYILCSTKERFERVTTKGRGFYRVKGAASNEKPEKASKSETDAILADAGVGTGVFSG